MSSNFDSLVDAITELVLQELGSATPAPSPAVSKPTGGHKPGTRILVAAGPREADASLWEVLRGEGLSPSALVWNGGRQDQLPASCSGWKVEARTGHWNNVVSGYSAVVLLGADLATLASMANFGGDGMAPSGAAVAAISSGKPVFVDNAAYEEFRRHSSRLASGFVRRFEDLYRLVGSFGIEFGGAEKLERLVSGLSGRAAPSASQAPRSGGRDVITVEDVEAVRRSGQKRMQVAMGTIVTPLAAQRASEWGIEVSFQ